MFCLNIIGSVIAYLFSQLDLFIKKSDKAYICCHDGGRLGLRVGHKFHVLNSVKFWFKLVNMF